MIRRWRRIQSMGAKIRRSDFRRQYPAVYQGLFVFSDAKRLPKDQPVINLGYVLRERLMGIPADRRCFEIDNCLRSIVETYTAVSLSHIEILFTPSLKLDAIGVLLSLCRNRKICLSWPGRISGNTLTYAEPSSPEYYEADYTRFIDTYVITE